MLEGLAEFIVIVVVAALVIGGLIGFAIFKLWPLIF